MALAPIDYGPAVQADTSGTAALQQAVAQHEAVFAEVKKLGGNIDGGAHIITQGILHNQALKATAAVKERQASTLSFIESNPYVPKAVLQQRMSPDDYQAWHAGLATEYQDKAAVPMFTAAGSLFDSEAKQARAQAGAIISLPGWRGAWESTEQTESSTIRERYVNRVAADQLVADQRAQAMTSHDSLIDSAKSKEDVEVAAKAAETSPWLPPAARRLVAEKDRVSMDSFDAEQAMRKQDVRGMADELLKLRSDNADELYPHMNEHQRLDLTQRLERQYGFHAAKTEANNIVGPNINPTTGKVDTVKIAKTLAAYSGENKDAVIKATQAAESEALRVFDAQASEIQKQVHTAGQDPRTAEFSMARAQANPAAAKAADWLNKNAPEKLTALGQIDIRRQRLEDMKDRQAAADEKKDLISKSRDNLQSVREWIDDETQAAYLRKLSPAQWDSELHKFDYLSPEDFDKARKEFATFQKRGGKSDERATTVVDKEILAAADGDRAKAAKLATKYRDNLLRMAHSTIRDNETIDPMALAEKIHDAVRGQLLKGAVVDGGKYFGDATTRYADWETNPDYKGKPFKLSDGTVIGPEKQMVSLTKGGQTMYFRAENADAARADGWK